MVQLGLKLNFRGYCGLDTVVFDSVGSAVQFVVLSLDDFEVFFDLIREVKIVYFFVRHGF